MMHDGDQWEPLNRYASDGITQIGKLRKEYGSEREREKDMG